MIGDDHEGVDLETKINSLETKIDKALLILEHLIKGCELIMRHDQLLDDLGTGTPGTPVQVILWEYGVRWDWESDPVYVEYFGKLELAMRMLSEAGGGGRLMRRPADVGWEEF